MRKIITPILFCSAAVISGLAQAGPDMKPGMWQVKIKSNQMQSMPKISDSQAAMMKRMGISMPTQSDDGMTTKICYTEEMIKNNEVTGQENSSDCKTTNVRQNGSTFAADIVCNGPDMKGKGSIKGTYNSTRFNSTYRFNGTSHGRKVNHTQTSSGTWLKAKCDSKLSFF